MTTRDWLMQHGMDAMAAGFLVALQEDVKENRRRSRVLEASILIVAAMGLLLFFASILWS